MFRKNILFLIILFLTVFSKAEEESLPELNPLSDPPAQSESTTKASKSAVADVDTKLTSEKPDGRRIRRYVSLVVGVNQDEELLIPDIPLTIYGKISHLDVKRIENTDMFRLTPLQVGSGIISLRNKKTGQTIVEIRFDIREDALEKHMRELQAMLSDIEGIEYKIVNNQILVDGYVLVPRDLIRIAQVMSLFPQGTVRSLVTLSPVARKKIAEFISNDVNNPEVKITAVGDYLKLEGQVNSEGEKTRILQIVGLYIPDLVIDIAPPTGNVDIRGKKNTGRIEDLIIDLITVRKDEERVEPVPKMIQVVVHFVNLLENYGKGFNFSFSPVVSAQAGAGQSNPTTTIGETAQLINNLLPKLNWAKYHGYAKVLDTASVLIQDRQNGLIKRSVTPTTLVAGPNGALQATPISGVTISINVTPVIKSERSGLIELPLTVDVGSAGKTDTTTTNVKTTITVRDRQSAAFGGVIKKDSDTSYNTPANPDAVITLQAAKSYSRNNSQFVVFVTPTIKSSASSGVEQVKKKFRVKD